MKKPPLFAPTKLEEQVTVVLFKAGLKPNQIDGCIYWAFGKGAWSLSPYEWLTRWRKLHPEHPVKDSYSFVKWMAVVGFLYQERLKWLAKRKKQQREN